MKQLATSFFLVFLMSFYGFSQMPEFYNDNTIGPANAFPLNSTTNNQIQWIYGPFLFNSQGATGSAAYPGYITDIYIKLNSYSAASVYTDFEISLGQNLGTQPNWGTGASQVIPFITGLTSVFYQASYPFTGQYTNNWYKVPLQTPFLYDPSQSLIVEVKVSGGTGNSISNISTTGILQRLYSGYGSTTGTANTGLTNIGFDMSPAASIDAGIASIDAPISFCSNTANDIIVTLRNFGTDSISSVDIHCEVDGIPLPVYNWTGTLGTVIGGGTFMEQVNLGPYFFGTTPTSIVAWTVNPNGLADSLNSNDTASIIASSTIASPTNLFANNITTVSADVSWSGTDTNNSWIYVVVPQGSPISSGTINPTILQSGPVSGLSAGSNFDLYVAEICQSGTDTSAWAGPYTFRTTVCPPGSWCFTTAGKVGNTGPTQAELNAEYTGTNLAGQVTSFNGIQEWQVPFSGTYRITAYGAQGSNPTGTTGGLGARISGEFILNGGDNLRILVGQTAPPTVGRENLSSPGGGGSFVTLPPHNTNQSILVIAGGGGGTGNEQPLTANASASPNGQTGSHGSGGNAGSGGQQGDINAGAGGGFFADGSNTNGSQGIAYVNGGAGGVVNGSWAVNGGGFGGGGSLTSGGNSRYGGGGGYSGGSSSTSQAGATVGLWGGGGGSFNNGLNPQNIGGNHEGPGFVVIELLSLPAAHDAGIQSIDEPSIYCSNTVNDVIVTLRNYGTDSLFLVDIFWEVDGIPQVPFTWTGGLAPSASGANFSTQVNLGPYTFGTSPTSIIAWTQNPNGILDTVNINDTSMVIVQPGLVSPTNVNVFNQTTVSADATWSGGSAANSWIYVVVPVGDPLSSGTIVTAATSAATITGLTAGTSYDLYVAELCPGATDTSAWQGPVNFSTSVCPPGAYCFTTAGKVGNTGPTQAELNTEYTGTNLAGQVTSINGIQEWQVPFSGTYKITAYGAQGSNPTGTTGGLGARISGEFILNGGDNLRILVGQTAPNTPGRENLSSSGGGGSFVTLPPHNTNASILVIAGGGGGTGNEQPLTANADAGPNGQTGSHGTGGTNGNAGVSGTATAGAGAGFFTDGSGTAGGLAYVNGGLGGAVNTTYSINGGGFGGGGSITAGGNSRYGGGGGYSGGAGSNSLSGATVGLWGGGGGSFNNGLNPQNTGGIHEGPGYVVIELISLPAADDAGIESIDEPTIYCSNTVNDVIVTLRNYGTDSLFLVDIFWEVDGIPQVPFTWTGGLAPSASGANFSTQVNLGPYTFGTSPTSIIAWTQNPNGILDTVNINDTSAVTVQPGLVPPSGISITNITTNSADAAWSGGSTANSWIYVVVPRGSPLNSGAILSSATTSANIVGLTATTQYDLYVAELCPGGTDTSAWAGPEPFSTTICAIGAYCFTNAGATGRTGPTQAQIDAEYASGNPLFNQVTSVNGIQEWTVPVSGTYKISALGAGFDFSSNQRGAMMQGEFDLVQGDILRIVVGQTGSAAINGSGGSFVVTPPYIDTSNVLIAAGGAGGWRSGDLLAMQGHIGINGNDGPGTSGNGGLNGLGGNGNTNAGGGGGFLGDGNPSNGIGGYAFINGAFGGNSSGQGEGGFGGGASSNSASGAAGGGGFSGGGRGWSVDGAGGGGSYNKGLNQSNVSGFNAGDGIVVFELLSVPTANDAGVQSIDAPTNFCSNTSNDVFVTIRNFGTDTLSIVDIGWEVDGIPQVPVVWTGVLPPAGSGGAFTQQVNLGPYIFGTTPANIVAWTFNPNGVADTVNMNDTAFATALPGLVAPTGLVVSNITANTADISWSGASATNSWIYVVVPTGNPITSGTAVNTPNQLASLTGLSSASVYDVYVAELCPGGTDTSAWLGPVTFQTNICVVGSYCFVTAGATGRTGPTQAQLNTAYLNSNLQGNVTSLSGIQEWVVPLTGNYEITAVGGKGGGLDGGLGALIQGVFALNAGDTLNILVGQEGQEQAGEPFSCGGGGGSFVTFKNPVDTNDILLIAGGGGGSPAAHDPGRHANTGPNGNGGVGATASAPGGTNGNGGSATDRGTGGGGFFTDGQASTQTAANAGGGFAYLNGGLGGTGTGPGAEGAFGGGGSTWQTGWRGVGGGGGFSGGGGAHTGSVANTQSAGGGGSFNRGTLQNNVAQVGTSEGIVAVRYLGGLAAIDAGVMSIDEPSNFCSNTSNDVIITIRNYGTDTITLLDIGWEIDGIPQVPFAWTGILPPSSSGGAFTQQVNLGPYLFGTTTANIVAWTSLPNGVVDSVNINDTAFAIAQPGLVAPTNLNVFNQTTITADATWSGGSAANSWIYVVVPAGDPLSNGTIVTTATSSATITGLVAGTSYDLYVAELCPNATDTSAWLGPQNFSTTVCPPGAYCFTTAGKVGNTGPTQAELNAEYTGTNLAGQVTSFNGIQEWQVPFSGTYKITAYGAQGSNPTGTTGGLGARISGEFILNGGDNLRILVGQTAPPTVGRENLSSPGGGGSFVTLPPHNTNQSILVIAGGGGGTGNEQPLTANASASPNGQTGSHGSGGNAGSGGQQGDINAGAGGGFFADGSNTNGSQGIAYVNGGAGGVVNGSWAVNGGGFGGGGSLTSGGNSRYGGGGGYSGGSSSTSQSGATVGLWGGGGGSFNNGLNPQNTGGIHEGPGYVVIELLSLPSANDAGIESIDEPSIYCSNTTNDVVVTLRNHGTDSLLSVSIGWEVDGIPQLPISWTGALAPAGAGINTDVVNLGPFTFGTNPTNIIAWTFNPNGVVDTVNLNDTATVTVQPGLVPPTAISITNISTNTATASWSGGSTANSWIYVVVPSGSPLSSGTILSSAITTANITGLSATTQYDFYVAELCPGGTDTSAWFGPESFATTICPSGGYCFTTAGATGRTGPTQAQINAEYSTGNLLANAVSSINGVQQWIVPVTGTYKISALGAGADASPNQRGALMQGEFDLTMGDTIRVVVGQNGSSNIHGSGGSFVVTPPYNDTSDVLVAAGGAGGWRSGNEIAMQGHVGINGGTSPGTLGDGGLNGLGGNGNTNTGGGGGFLGDGNPSNGIGGYAFINGAFGGNPTGQGEGGFGGGASTNTTLGAGGGGGFSGGGRGYNVDGAGGGGSFNRGLNQNNVSGFNAGEGIVVFELISTPGIVDAGVASIDNPFTFCENSTDSIVVTIENFGPTKINNVTINWSVNGAVQAPVSWSGTLDTLNGTGSTTAQVNLGNFQFGTGGANILAWTSMPNGNVDSLTSNDTASTVAVGLQSPAQPMGSPDAFYCLGDAVAPSTVSGSGGTLEWFSNPQLTNLVSTGTFYQASSTVLGTQSFYVVETGTNGCKSRPDTINVTINQTPGAAVLGSDLAFCQGVTLPNLTAGATAGLSTNWYNSSAMSSPLATTNSFNPTPFLSAGVNVIYARLVAGGCEGAADSMRITLSPQAQVSIDTVAPICINDAPFTLNAQSNVPGTGFFSGNNVDSSGLFTPSTTGSSVVAYNFTDTVGCAATANAIIQVNAAPVLSLGGNVSTCEGVSASIGVAQSGLAYNWNTGDTAQNIAVNPQATTTYTVTATNSFGCSSVDSVQVIVNPNPVVNVNNQADVCQNSGLIALVGGTPFGGAYSGDYVFGGLFNSDSSGSGLNTIYYTFVDGNGCEGRDSAQILVNQIPSVTINQLPAICENSSGYTLVEGQPAGGVYSGSNVSSGVLTPGAAGTDTIIYTYTDPSTGCSNSISREFQVLALPTVTFSGLTEICEGVAPITLFGGTPNGGNYSGANVAGGQFDPANSGTFTLTYTYEDNNGCVNSDTTTIDVLPAPVVNITDSAIIGNQRILNAGSWSSYLWSTGAVTRVITVSPGTYTVTVTDGNGCEGSATIDALPTGITELNGEISMKYFPNPTGGQFEMVIGGLDGKELQIQIFDLTGKVVTERRVVNNHHDQLQRFDLSHESQGIYIIRLVAEDKVMTGRITIR